MNGGDSTKMLVVDPRAEPLGDDHDELVRGSTNPSFFLSSVWTNTWVETYGDVVEVWAMRAERDGALIGDVTLALTPTGDTTGCGG